MDRIFWDKVGTEIPPTENMQIGYPNVHTTSDRISRAGARWFYMITEEIRNLIRTVLEPNYKDPQQTVKAVQLLIGRITRNTNIWLNSQVPTPIVLDSLPIISLDLNASSFFTLELKNNLTFGSPRNATNQSGVIVIKQTGDYTVSFSNVFKFPEDDIPEISLEPNTYSLIIYQVLNFNTILCNFITDIQQQITD